MTKALRLPDRAAKAATSTVDTRKRQRLAETFNAQCAAMTNADLSHVQKERYMKTQRRLLSNSILILLICAAYILWGACFIYKWKANGTLLSVRDFSGDLSGILLQNVIVSAVPMAIFLIAFMLLRGNFADAMYLKVAGKKQWTVLLILVAVLMAIAIFCLVANENWISVLYSLIYYLVFVAFAEEFVVRGVCVYLLREEKATLRYIVPNAIFALMHLFSYAQWGPITEGYVFSFITSSLLGLVAGGCIFQFLKDKTGTIWIPVLVHAIMDFSAVLGYK